MELLQTYRGDGMEYIEFFLLSVLKRDDTPGLLSLRNLDGDSFTTGAACVLFSTGSLSSIAFTIFLSISSSDFSISGLISFNFDDSFRKKISRAILYLTCKSYKPITI